MEAAVLKYALNGGTLNQERIIQELTIKYEDLNPDDSDEEITDDSEDSSDDEEALIGKTSKAKKTKNTSKGMTQVDAEKMIKEAVEAALVSTNQKSCSICGKIGHLKADCFSLPKNAEKNGSTSPAWSQRDAPISPTSLEVDCCMEPGLMGPEGEMSLRATVSSVAQMRISVILVQKESK